MQELSADIVSAVKEIKSAIVKAQSRVAANANAEMLSLYFGIGQYVSHKTKTEKWGTGVIDAISRQLQQEMPGLRGFGARNIRNMRQFYEKWEEERNGRKYRGETKVKDGEYEYLIPYNRERKIEDAIARLEKDLKDEAERKYDFIIERTNAIVGEITDASGLKVGAKGDLNGYIKGTRGMAKVQTIGAGGYNIQCFHFRTLIHAA